MIDELKNAHFCDRDDQLKLDTERHIYTVNDVEYTSVTRLVRAFYIALHPVNM